MANYLTEEDRLRIEKRLKEAAEDADRITSQFDLEKIAEQMKALGLFENVVSENAIEMTVLEDGENEFDTEAWESLMRGDHLKPEYYEPYLEIFKDMPKI